MVGFLFAEKIGGFLFAEKSGQSFNPINPNPNFTTMELVQLFFLLLTIACLFFFVIGLFKPWAMLWWEDVQNRRKVIKVYGSAGLACYVIYWGLRIYSTI